MSDLDKEELEATRNIGKTADGLSEEEIIKTVENFLDGYRQYNVETGETYVPYKYGEGQKFCYVEDFEAIQGLLDLYNKEKEKNKILELAKIPYLEGEIMAYKENTVSKDKIKEIIYPTPTNPISYEIQTSDMYRKILQLLEEK